MELHHFIRAGSRLCSLANPPLHNSGALRIPLEQMSRADQSRTADLTGTVHDRLLDVTLDRAQHGRIDDPRQYAQGIGPVQIDVARHILGQGGRDDDDVVRVARLGHVLDKEIHHPTEAGIVAHEQFGHAEKHLGRLGAVEILAGVGEVQELRDDGAAFSGVFADGGGIVEAASLLEDRRLFEVGVRGVIIGAGTLVLELEFIEGVLDLREEVVHC
mmetsp:Transcript_33255/g.80445  ORF Transcript_33255/g.80445 Transcript_33255/m.80445 type:complete len:216 (-) Transcript_33255:144-791(-)